MKNKRLFIQIFFCMLLAACGAAPDLAARSSQPGTVSDPYTLARQLIEQVTLSDPTGWQVTPCEGEAAVLCISSGQDNAGYAELQLFPLAGYPNDHPIRMAATMVPEDVSAYTTEQQKAAQQALADLAKEHLAAITADRAISYPEGSLTPLPAEPVQMGGLPALAFGFVHTNGQGDVMERYLHIAAFDQEYIYWFGINYDPANVSTFVSDTAVTQFAPTFFELAAGLPIRQY